MMFTPTPIIIPQNQPSKSPAVKANEAAIERYTGASEREAFEAGARYERGEDGEWPWNWYQTIFGISLALYIFAQPFAAFAGLINGPRTHWEDNVHVQECALAGRWNYVFPGYVPGCYARGFLDGPSP